MQNRHSPFQPGIMLTPKAVATAPIQVPTIILGFNRSVIPVEIRALRKLRLPQPDTTSRRPPVAENADSRAQPDFTGYRGYFRAPTADARPLVLLIQ